MKQYLGLSRYWYNQAVQYLKGEGTKASLYEVRLIQKNEHPDWAFNCPQRIREHAIADACSAVHLAKRKYAKAHKFQKVKFRSKKDIAQGFGLDSQSINSEFMFSKKAHRVYFRATENINPSLEGTRVVFEYGNWYLILPQEVNKKIPENQRYGIVALDPGVRTFMTLYSEQIIGKIAEGNFKNIYRLCRTIDKLIGLKHSAKSKRKYRLNKALVRARNKVKNYINDLHYKTAHFLVTTFDTILIPVFRVSNMVSKLHSKTARNMLNFAHYRFKTFLKAKAEEYSCTVIEVSEAYTSKTCSYCGTVQNIGSKSVLKCQCGAKVDRDLNGARGIYLRALRAPALLPLS